MNKILPADIHILHKLAFSGRPLDRWIEFVNEFDLEPFVKDSRAAKLVIGDAAKSTAIQKAAMALRHRIMQET